jgi:branched-chain amino acid aminotransferase
MLSEITFKNKLRNPRCERRKILMAKIEPMDSIWMDEKLVPWQEATIHITTHSLLYGITPFEGIRIYKCTDGRSAIFRLHSHIDRLFNTAKITGIIKIPFTRLGIEQAVIETVQKNKLEEGYIRPLVLIGVAGIGPLPDDNSPIQVAIIPCRFGHYLGEGALERGIRVKISKWRRDNRVLPWHAKLAGHYINAALAKKEAKESGYDEGLVLDSRGCPIEGSAENLFIVKDGKLLTPSLEKPILAGITRNSVIHLAQDRGITVKDEETILKDDLYDVDEAFFCGTAAEITPIKALAEEDKYGEIDEFSIGKVCPGVITKKLQELFFKAVRGEIPQYQKEWLTYVDFQ